MANAYSPPAPFSWPSIPTRSLLPVFPPPEQAQKPDLPCSPRQPAFSAPYTLSTHIVPAAYLRSTDHVQVPPPAPRNSTKSKRQEHATVTIQKLRDLRGSLEPRGKPHVLWNCINRYVKNGLEDNRKPGVTLFFAHANGYPKEIWEPTLAHLLTSPAASAIDEVWTWESVQTGDACLINGSNLGGVYDWADNARDILNFLLYFLPSEAKSSSLPVHLECLPTAEAEHRKTNTFRARNIVVAGHSFGGCTSTLAALHCPTLFSSILLLDPVIVKPTGILPAYDTSTTQLVFGALTRRETWSSWEEAYRLLSKSPFFGAWDPVVLKVYIECGLYPTKDPVTGEAVVALKMSGIQEATVFSDSHTKCEVYHQLPKLDARIDLRWIMPGKPGAGEFGVPGATRERVWLRPENASNTRIPHAGHLIPQEQPRLLAEDIDGFIRRRYIPLKCNL